VERLFYYPPSASRKQSEFYRSRTSTFRVSRFISPAEKRVGRISRAVPRWNRVKVLTLGRPYFCDEREGARLIRNSEADIVSKDPPVLRLIQTPNFTEEVRYLTGYLVNSDPDRDLRKLPAHILRRIGVKARIVRTGFKGRKSRKIRTRRPRRAMNPDYLEFRRLMDRGPVKRGEGKIEGLSGPAQNAKKTAASM